MGWESVVGFRFHPTDEELVNYYLTRKILGMDSEVDVIPEVDICNCEPWDLPGLSAALSVNPVMQSNDQKWYFFCPREVKNPNGSNRSKRATKAGYWKPTGKDREVKYRGTNRVIGTKKTLVFYKGRAPNSERTTWVIHEYHVTANDLTANKKSFVLCLLKNKADCNDVEPSSSGAAAAAAALNNGHHISYMDFDDENPVASEETTLELDEMELQVLLECFPESTYQQPEQGPSSYTGFPYSDGGFSNNPEGMQFQLDAEEPCDYDWTTLLADENESPYQRNLAVTRSEMPERHVVRVSSACSLTTDYVKDSESSSETDTEVTQSQHDPIVETLRSLNRNVGLSQAGHYGTLPSSNSHQYRRKNIGSLHDESVGSNASSLVSAADRHCLQLTNPNPVNITTRRSHNFVAQRTSPGRICVQQKVVYQGKVRESSGSTEKHEGKPHSVEARDAATNLPQKEKSIVVSDNDLGIAQEVDANLSLKSRWHGSADSNQKGYVIFLETPLVRHRSSSPSVCAVNVLLGIVLFGLITWDLGKCW